MILRFLDRALLDDVLAHAREGIPEEVCGILAGRDVDGVREVHRVFRVKNVHDRPIGEYLIDPGEQLRVILDVEDVLGLDVVGFYHSHPVGPDRLSTTDKARATWPSATYFLVWLKPEEGYGAWTWDADRNRFPPQPVEIAPGEREADASGKSSSPGS